ncbi:hypothetical protein C1H46_007397 [Malus baccata]|uniref:Uncharacterized protein n=1 Tax=Malus baccata TaxID=106549 RepID=A0A540N7I3_MALBA|nr:hypothetical protein C1H46_007397 [Malus baccata]
MKLSRLPASDSPQSCSLSTCGIILINLQAQFQHRVNSPGKGVGVIKAETRGQKTSVIEQQHMVLELKPFLGCGHELLPIILLHCLPALTDDVVNVLLALPHPGDIILLAVLMDSRLEILRESLVKLDTILLFCSQPKTF